MQTGPPAAPYQIEGIEISANPFGAGVARMVVVGLGRAPDLASPEVGIPVPAGDDLEWLTLLGTTGRAHAYRVRVERRCEFLCGYEESADSEECHWVGLYSTHAPLDVGDVVAAVPGRLELIDYLPLAPISRPSQAGDPLAELTTSREPVALLWDDYGARMTLRVEAWDAAAGRIAAFLGTPYGEGQPLNGQGCRAAAYEWLLAIECDAFAVLASGGEPLLVSLADYGMPGVVPIARFEYAGSRHNVVRFGAKAQDVVGFVSAEPAGWRARFRPRDWTLMC